MGLFDERVVTEKFRTNHIEVTDEDFPISSIQPIELFVDGENKHKATTYKEFNDEQFKTAIMQELRAIRKLLEKK